MTKARIERRNDAVSTSHEEDTKRWMSWKVCFHLYAWARRSSMCWVVHDDVWVESD